MKRSLQAALLVLAVSSGCSSTHQTHEGHTATLWVETSPEYRIIAMQAYELAREQLPKLLADSSASALAEGQPNAAELPPAVILDVDETVLDNTPYQSQLVLDGEEFSEESWSTWVRRAEAQPIPGALEFVQAARDAGVQVFYLTNRDASAEAATRENLLKAGFPIDEREIDDVVLTNGERDGWGSDKKSRRDVIAATHRVVMLIGDDLNDFVSGARSPDPMERLALADQHRARWGVSWIVLPNPLYGSWEASLYGRDYSLTRDEKMRRKDRHLKGYR